MYRRDYLLKQIEEFAQMLARLMKANGLNQKDLARQILDEAYEKFLHTQARLIKDSAALTPDKIQEKFKYKNEQMEFLARMLFEESLIFSQRRRYAECALTILEYLNEKQKLYAFEREELIKRIKSFLGESSHLSN